MCLFNALSKCKTDEDRKSLMELYKVLVNESQRKFSICKELGRHTWTEYARGENPENKRWLCEICNMAAIDKNLWDQRLQEMK